jgi:hypothetical protein
VLRKDAMNEWKGRKRLKSSGLYVSALREEYNNYSIVLTSLGKEIRTEKVLDVYRTRWQIAIAFKRLQSLFRYKPWFYGKRLLAALGEMLVNTGRFSPAQGNESR